MSSVVVWPGLLVVESVQGCPVVLLTFGWWVADGPWAGGFQRWVRVLAGGSGGVVGGSFGRAVVAGRERGWCCRFG
jgi:hypothetical protein